MSDLNPYLDPATDNTPIPKEVQDRLNQPLAGGILSDEDRQFLELLHRLVDEKKIELYKPSSLLNDSVYQALTLEHKAKADLAAMNMLSKIRDIVSLDRAAFDTNIQVQNLLSALRLAKERAEQESGDVFII